MILVNTESMRAYPKRPIRSIQHNTTRLDSTQQPCSQSAMGTPSIKSFCWPHSSVDCNSHCRRPDPRSRSLVIGHPAPNAHPAQHNSSPNSSLHPSSFSAYYPHTQYSVVSAVPVPVLVLASLVPVRAYPDPADA
jgi:hypothetical protein